MQATQRLHEAPANLAFAARLRRKERKGLAHRLEQLREIVVFAIRDVALTKHRPADAFDQGLGEVKRQSGILGHRLLDAFHLLLDMRQPACDRIAGAVHDEGSSESLSHKTALPKTSPR